MKNEKPNVTAAVKDAILALFAQPFGDTTTFDNLGADSLDMLELLMHVEDRLEVEIPDNDTWLETSATVAEYIAKVETFLRNNKS